MKYEMLKEVYTLAAAADRLHHERMEVIRDLANSEWERSVNELNEARARVIAKLKERREALLAVCKVEGGYYRFSNLLDSIYS